MRTSIAGGIGLKNQRIKRLINGLIRCKSMNKAIKKYGLLLILSKLCINLIPLFLFSVYPEIGTIAYGEKGSRSFGIGYFEWGISYGCNIVIALFMYNDMKKCNIKSPLLVLLTLCTSLIGTLFFLFLLFEKLKINRTPHEEQATETVT